MDFKDLSLGEPFRGWYLNGLKYVFKTDPNKKNVSIHEQENNKASPGEFPSPWHEIWNSSNPPYQWVWTYWKLSDDCSLEPNQARIALFNNILTALGLKKEEILFWPLTVRVKDQWIIHKEIFWQGIEIVEAESIVCLGKNVFEVLFPDMSTDYTKFEYGKFQVFFIPGPEDMLPDNRQAKKIAWNILKNTK